MLFFPYYYFAVCTHGIQFGMRLTFSLRTVCLTSAVVFMFSIAPLHPHSVPLASSLLSFQIKLDEGT